MYNHEEAFDQRIKRSNLPESAKEELLSVSRGEVLPQLHSDIIAKKIFDPDQHPERLESLMRAITGDSTIKVKSSARQEGFRQAVGSKSVIHDVTAWLMDGRSMVTEFQDEAQPFVLKRGEVYSSNALVVQYSVAPGELKKEVDYQNARGVYTAFLLVNSPEPFIEHDAQSDKYIHRFYPCRADSGLCYDPLAKMVYVQLDKCLRQFLKGENAEAENGINEEMQAILSLIADSRNTDVVSRENVFPAMHEIMDEMRLLAQDKEVQEMLLQEEIAELDYRTSLNLAEQKGLDKGLIVLVRQLKPLTNDFDDLYRRVISNPEFANVTKEKVSSVYYSC